MRDHSRDLERSLNLALGECRYRAGSSAAPQVRLDAAWRVRPKDFQGATRDIAEVIKSRRVVSIDLSLMQPYEAARLIDYCHGLAACSEAWIFRLAESVIVISHDS
ncbi:cell division protein SepF [Micromonospora lutea]|uniref:cell division protein SepF n=1 Tax=Micromonospora lutea TaxID=419825 RepID=UPI00357095FD